MPSRLPPVCESAPTPAMLAWDSSGAAAWELNRAAQDWAPTRLWLAGEWSKIARCIVDHARDGHLHGEDKALGLCWRAVETDGAWLAWLMPCQALPDPQLLQLGLAVGLVGIVLYRIDMASQRIQLNEWGYRLLGREPQPDGLPLDDIRELIHPDDRSRIKLASEQAMSGSAMIDTEARYRSFDGSYRTLLTRRIAERDEHGAAIGLVGVSLDVTEQVQERDRVLNVAQSIELVADATGVGVWSVDLQSGAMVWNGQMHRIYGLSDDMPLPQARDAAIHFTHEADRERVVAIYDQLATGAGTSDDFEFRVVRPGGEVRWVVARARYGRNGDRAMMFGVLIDVTEQRKTQERLRRAEQRAMLAAQAVGLAIWERDLVDGESWWDAQMYRLRGLPADEARSPDELRHQSIHPDDVAFVERRTAEIIDHENDYYFDFRVRWPDGAVRWLAARGNVVRDEAGRALRILGINWDITEHKIAEEMQRQKAAAEEASRAKSEFLSRMSHELRTPLNAVLGFAQLMLDDPSQPLADKQRERTDRIREAGKHLLALIDDVLDLTSVEAGSLSMAPVEIEPLLREMLQWVAPAAQRAKVDVHVGSLAGAAVADARRLRQVLANLLSNAVKYNQPGGRVDVDTFCPAPEAGRRAWVAIRVSDSGRGLTPAQLQQLFEPFNRLGAEREGIEGTGIGLTIVRSLVEHMQGRVEVQSQPGQGSEFRVWLARANGTQAANVDEPGAVDARGKDGADVIDVLYIEDNPVNVMLVQELVTMRPKVRLHSAPDGRSGIAMARSLRPRAVLIDLQLPDIDGFEVLRALREDDAMRDTDCIALSANAMPEDISRAMSLGFDGYWTKPIDFKQFLAGLDVLAGSRRRT